MKLTDTIRAQELMAFKLQGHTRFAGLPISIENKKGSTRSGVDAEGKPWSVKMPFDYGYIGRTKGPDGDAYDCFIGPNANAKFAYVVHQCKQLDRDKWDEDKVMLGFDSADAAIRGYKSAYNNVDLFHSMTVMPIECFKKKVKATFTKKKQTKLHAGGPGSGRHKELYHGTNDTHAAKIQKEGLHTKRGESTVTTDKKYATRAAKLRAKEEGGKPVVVVLKPSAIKYFKIINLGPEFGNRDSDLLDGNGLTVKPEHIARIEIKAVNYGGYVGEDYRQFREGTAIQPMTNNHPPSLKNPQKVEVDNPDDEEGKKKRKRKANREYYTELARRQTGKPELVNTTIFVPISQG